MVGHMNSKKNNKLRRRAITLIALICLLSNSLVAFADFESEPLNNQQTAASQLAASSRTQVSGDSTSEYYNTTAGAITIMQNDVYDSIYIYKIADVKWNTSKKTYNAATWTSPVTTWRKESNNSSYNYSTPASLNKQTTSKQQLFYTHLLSNNGSYSTILPTFDTDGKTITADTYGMNSFLYGIYLNHAYKRSTNSDYTTADEVLSYNGAQLSYSASSSFTVGEDTYSSKGMVKTTEYDIVASDTANNYTFYSESELTDAGFSAEGGTYVDPDDSTHTFTYTVSTSTVYGMPEESTDGEGNTITVYTYYKSGDKIVENAAFWRITNIPFGIYAVIAKNDSGINYSPVVVAVAPNQQPPEGYWFFDDTAVASLKGGDVNIDKLINGKDQDIVEIGETVTFSVTTSFPQAYKDRVILSKSAASTSTSAVKNYTLTFDDDMSDAFTVDTSTFHLYYRESLDGEWKEFSDYKNVSYYALADSTYVGDKTLIDTSISDTDFKRICYDDDQDSSTSLPDSTFKNGSYYYANLYADAYTYLIAGKSITKDVNFSYSDTRGGWGISIFACSNTASHHEKYYQQYLFRYKDKPNLYYWYYYRDGAYHLICVDYYNSSNKKTYRTSVVSTAESIYADPENPITDVTTLTSTLGMTQVKYTVNLTNSSSYLKNVRDTYKSITGDTVQHSVCYYPDWATSVFNITFDYNALRQWMENKNVNQIVQLRVEYDATVTTDAKINSEENTNTATLTYETNAKGTTLGYKDDTVKAYTYGINVVKQDGSTVDDVVEDVYLGGVKFELFKEVDAFVNDKYYGSMADSSDSKGYTSDLDLATYKTTHPESEYYYYEYTASGSGTLDANYLITETTNELGTTKLTATEQNNHTYSEGDKIVRVFKPYQQKVGDTYTFDKEFESTATAEGYSITGVSDGNYVLVETKALTGYNDLAEDILFSIYPLNETIATSLYGNSYAIFADDANGGHVASGSLEADEDGVVTATIEGITDDDGIYDLLVLNYKGLTLPSTGGMGTLIFTILGICIMIFAIIYIMVKNRRNAEAYM